MLGGIYVVWNIFIVKSTGVPVYAVLDWKS